MNTGIYIRVSTEDQAKDGFSIDAQKEKLTKYAEANDWNIYSYYIDDGISGKNIENRPEMKRMLEDVKNGRIKNILVYKLDRLTRSLLNLMELIELFDKCECSLNSHTEKLDTSNAVGRMFVKIIGTFAEFERENLAERVSFGYEEKTRQGNYTNTNGVFGYDYVVGEGVLKPNEQEKIIVKKIYEMYLNGDSMVTICKKLTKDKIPTKRGGKWSQSTIMSILENPLYIGKVRYGVNKKISNKAFTVEKTEIPPILDTELYEAVQQLKKTRRNFKSKKYSSDSTYFFRVLKCSKCGGKMYAKQQIQSGKKYITYTCCNKKYDLCNAGGFSHYKLEEKFQKYLENIELFIPTEEIMTMKKNNSLIEEKVKLEKELIKIEKKMDETRNLYVDGSFGIEDYKKIAKKLENRKNTFEEEIQNIKVHDNPETYSYDDIKNLICDIKLNWEYMIDKERKNFLERFIKGIVVEKIGKEVVIKEVQFSL